MSDDARDEELLEALGGHLREREAAWEAVAQGRRSVEEVAAERAAAGDSEADIELARALYRPLQPSAAELELLRAEPPPAPAKPANSGRYLWWSMVAAVAVAVLVLVVLPRGSEHPQLAQALPSYSFEAGEQRAFVRGDPQAPAAGEPLRYHPSNRVEWTLRPELEVEGALGTRIHRLDEDGGLVALELGEALGLRASGAATLDLRARELGLEPGSWTLVWVVGRRSALDGSPELAELEADPAVHVERVQVRIDAE